MSKTRAMLYVDQFLTTKNEDAQMINNLALQIIGGNISKLNSTDYIQDDDF